MTYIVSFKSDTYSFGSGDSHGREFATREQAEAFAASLAGAEAYDVEVEECEDEDGDPAEPVLVQLGPL